jgi:hypothetical protein
MSYVIQNFAKKSHHVVVTPRFKIFLILKWMNFFLFFFRFDHVYKKKLKFVKLFFFFFRKGLFTTFYNSLKNLSANYSNKITNTAVYWSFNLLNNFWDSKVVNELPIEIYNSSLFNSYFLSIKTINVKITKTYFKYVYFFFLFYLSDLWLQFDMSFKFYLNFFFIRNNFKIYKFHNGYFLRLYNF